MFTLKYEVEEKDTSLRTEVSYKIEKQIQKSVIHIISDSDKISAKCSALQKLKNELQRNSLARQV